MRYIKPLGYLDIQEISEEEKKSNKHEEDDDD